MTYRGREITEGQITVEMIRDIVLNDFLTSRKCSTRIYKFTTWGFLNKDKIFDYNKALDKYLSYLHHFNSKPPVDLESGLMKILERFETGILSDELLAYRKQKEEAWKARKRKEREEQQSKNVPGEDPGKTDKKVPVTGVVEIQLNHGRQNYQEQLEDLRWTAFRTFVFVVKGQKCEQCGSTHYLNIHHIKYIPNRKAWEYTCNEVQVLCKECHEKVHNIQKGA